MAPREWGAITDADGGVGYDFSGVFEGHTTRQTEDNTNFPTKMCNGMPLIFNTDRISSWKGGYNETRPKTKYYNLLIYAGYPITQQ